jgi:transcriptional regulator with XRE-family HTH domain
MSVATEKARPRPGAPASTAIKQLRQRARRTQAQAAQLLEVSERQFQRWEAGDQEMPSAAWRLFKLTCGYRFPVDFAIATERTRGWDPGRDRQRDTIEQGDTVYLQAIEGPMIEARVWLDRIHDGLVDENSYGAFVVGFPGRGDAGQEYEGFYIGERITFSAANVVHCEQRPPLPNVKSLRDPEC